MKTISDRIKAERTRKGWSQEDLAKKAGISQSFIGALESGNQKSSGWLPEIAHALGVDAYWLKTGRGLKDISAPLSTLPNDIRAQVEWIIANADEEIRVMFAFLVHAAYTKKIASKEGDTEKVA